jgi:hypothetical protein
MKENFNSKLDSNYIVYLDGKFLKRDFFNWIMILTFNIK